MLFCAVSCCVTVKGGKRSARDSQYIRSILTGVNPAAPGEGQVGGVYGCVSFWVEGRQADHIT